MKKVPDDYNDDKAYRVAYLIAAFIRNTLTDEEREELDEWVTESDENMKLFAELTDERNIKANLDRISNIDKDRALKELLERFRQTDEKKDYSPAIGTRWIYIAAASVALLIAAFFIYRPFIKDKTPVAEIIQTDLQPGGNKAILTLSDGSQLILDSLHNDSLIRDGNTSLTKTDGQIEYAGNQSSQTDAVLYNTITTPNGGQYKVVLPDGSKVWLNASSSMKYPTSFAGRERKVEVTGEAYFEIVKVAGKSFIVTCKDLQTEVLGTAFNINAYDDEASTRVTLLEGSVKVVSGTASIIMKPGQQAKALGSELIELVPEPDTEEAVSWKDGKFYFKNASIEDIMRQVARWYDVKVEYEAKPRDHFNAVIARDVPVSRLFELLQKTGEVNFTITDKKIIVKP